MTVTGTIHTHITTIPGTTIPGTMIPGTMIHGITIPGTMTAGITVHGMHPIHILFRVEDLTMLTGSFLTVRLMPADGIAI